MIKKILVLYYLNKMLKEIRRDIDHEVFDLSNENVGLVIDDLVRIRKTIGENIFTRRTIKKINNLIFVLAYKAHY